VRASARAFSASASSVVVVPVAAETSVVTGAVVVVGALAGGAEGKFCSRSPELVESLPELSAQDAEDYVRIAVELAGNQNRLVALRSEMRARMRSSALMDVTGFTRQLEQCMIGLYRHIDRTGVAIGKACLQK